MKFSDWFLAVVATFAVWAGCTLWENYTQEPITLPEIIVHGHSSTN